MDAGTASRKKKSNAKKLNWAQRSSRSQREATSGKRTQIS